MKRLILNLILALGMVVIAAQPMLAADKPKITVLKGGYVSQVVGYEDDGRPIYQADFGAPKYLDDLKTPIDTKWHFDDQRNMYVSGDNKFTSQVQGELVGIKYKGESMSWLPNVSVSNLDKKLDKSGVLSDGMLQSQGKPKLLKVDPLNENYSNNTLEWDYGNGVLRRLRLIEGMTQEYYVIAKPIGGDLNIASNFNKTPNVTADRKASAWDASGKTIDIEEREGHNVKLAKEKGADAKLNYPIIIDPDVTFVVTASDGYNNKETIDPVLATSWDNAHDSTSAGTSVRTSNYGNVTVGSRFDDPNYDTLIQRAYLFFDTSAIPSGAVVAAATVKLKIAAKTASFGAWTLQIREDGAQTFPHDPIQAGDYLYSNYAGSGGTLASGSMTVGSYNDIALTAAWVVKAGVTKLELQEKEHDINDAAPATYYSYWQYNAVQWYSYEAGSGYWPQLVVTYTPAAPAITSQLATGVAQTTARLNSTVTDDGGDTTVQVSFGYGTASHTAADFLLYDTVTSPVDGYHKNDTPYLDVTGLIATTTYYFRARVTNSDSTVISTTEQTFTTETSVGDVANFAGIPYQTSVSLSWTKGTGASNVAVRVRTDTYPTTPTNGSYVYFGPLSTVEQTSIDGVALTAGTTYYYAAWGESGGTYSADVSRAMLVVTTLGADNTTLSAGDSFPIPTLPANWNQTPTASGLSKLEPFYSIINTFATDWAMGSGNMWLGFALFGIAIGGIITYLKVKNIFVSMLVVEALIIVGIGAGVVPGWMFIIPLEAGLGIWAIEHNFQ